MFEKYNEVANVLKEILRESNESVCPTEYYEEFLDCSANKYPELKDRA